MILEMVGHRDPNLVPVAAFYGDPDLKVNFCGKLAADANPQVGLGATRHGACRRPLEVGKWVPGPLLHAGAVAAVSVTFARQ